jgi:nitrate reductase NapD
MVTEELHVASLVVQSRPERLAHLERTIAAMPGADIPAGDASGKLVVTLESSSEHELGRLLDEIAAMPGVLSATLVYHHAEPVDAETEGAP